MQFVKTEELKIGMRLARPIYSKKGVLLFERNSKLSSNAIDSVRNFGLLGIYILEPAEPLPPMTEEDLEFERFQTKTIFSIQEELENIINRKPQLRIQLIADIIIKNFGHFNDKVNFYQNLRSKDDYTCRHALNVAILCAMITHMLNMRREEQFNIILAALVHDIGKIQLGGELICRDDLDEDEQLILYNAQLRSAELIERSFNPNGAPVRRICMQAAKLQMATSQIAFNKVLIGAKILAVANRYDELTAMSLGGETKSEVKAIRELLSNPDIYEPEVVDALIQSVNILFPGVSVELNTGEKALVLVENKENILQPTVLIFRDNSILDLSLKFNEDIEIVDIMKTMDNRYIMDMDKLKSVGYDT